MQQLNLIQPPKRQPITLRPYQEAVLEGVAQEARAGNKHIALYMSCGAGKTIVSASLIDRAVDKIPKLAARRGTKPGHILFGVHLDALVGQTAEKLDYFGIQPGFIKAGWDENRYAMVQIASLQTMQRRDYWRKMQFDVIILDECLAGDSLVETREGVFRIDDPNIVGKHALSFNEDAGGLWQYRKITRQVCKGNKPVVDVKAGMHSVRCTKEHPVRTVNGWKQAGDLMPGELIVSPRMTPAAWPVKGAAEDYRIKLAITTDSAPTSRVLEVQDELVWDIEVEENHNFVANGLLVHNCHISRWFKVAEELIGLNPDAVEIGLSGSPFRLSAKEAFGDKYNAMVAGPMPVELRDMGFLSPLKYYGLTRADLKGVRKVRGDFSEKQLAVVCNKEDLVAKAVDEWFRLTPGKRTLAYCVGQDHARAVAEEFRKRGVPVGVVLGDTPAHERKRLYAEIKSGKTLVLTSCNVISIGFDEPSVEVGLMLRPTQSYALWVQMLGRIQRISPDTGKTIGYVLDQAGNYQRLGPIEALTRDKITLKKGRKSGYAFEAFMKACPVDGVDDFGKQGCGLLMNAFHQHCPDCGYVFAKDNWVEQSGKMEELIPGVPTQQREYFVKLIRTCIENKRSPGQAAASFKRRYYKRPQKGHTRGALYDDGATQINVDKYFRFLCEIAIRQNKSPAYVKTWMTKEFGDDWKGLVPDPDGAFNMLKMAGVVLSRKNVLV